MSHSQIIFSPAGTPLLARTVGELVAERPGRSRIFQAAGIDFCCQGGRTLQEACERKGLAADSIVEQLEAELAGTTAIQDNPAELPLPELVDYIISTHHAYLREELPRLYAMAERVAQVHGPHTPSLVELLEVYTGMSRELAHHLMKEEQVLFPAIKAISGEGHSAGATPMPLDQPIERMVEEHEEAGAALARIRELTNGYTPPADACNTYRALFAGLAEMEEDLHRHIHLENSVLFPRAAALTEKISA